MHEYGNINISLWVWLDQSGLVMLVVVASPLLVLREAHHHLVFLHPLMYKQSLDLRDR